MGSSEVQGKLWGKSAKDWADLFEPMSKPIWIAMLNSTDVKQETRFLDPGCGGGGASVLANERGAQVILHKRHVHIWLYNLGRYRTDTAFKNSIHKYARDAQSADEVVPQVEMLVLQTEKMLRVAGSRAELVLCEKDHISQSKPI